MNTPNTPIPSHILVGSAAVGFLAAASAFMSILAIVTAGPVWLVASAFTVASAIGFYLGVSREVKVFNSNNE